MKVLILGGTGVISRAIVDRLLAQGHEVVAYNRGNKQLKFAGPVAHITGDRADRATFTSVMQSQGFDVVIDMICFTEEDAISTVETFRDRVEQIIVCSSSSAYRRPYRTVPIQEDAELLCEDPIFPYSFNKAQIERYLQRQIRDARLPITIIRPSYTVGAGHTGLGVLRQAYGIVDRIRKGKPLLMFGDGNNPWSFTFAPDLAKAFAGAVGNSKTYGQHYHATSEWRTVWNDLYLEFGKILGHEVKLFNLPSQVLYHAAPKLCAHLYYEKSFAGLFDNNKIKRDVPEFEATITLNQGLTDLLAWYEAEFNVVDAEKDALEDQLFEIHTGLMRQVENIYAK
jgi:nucleoside-diphosphate-sugar epimerase